MDIQHRMSSIMRDDAVLEQLSDGGFLQDVLNDPSVESVADGARGTLESPNHRDLVEAVDRMRVGQFDPANMVPAEAIIVRFGYPSLLVQNGTFVQPALPVWRQRLNPHRQAINHAIAGSGRIEVYGLAVGGQDPIGLGTGWMIDERTVVTNRHVAKYLASGSHTRVQLRPGIRSTIDYREEHGVPGEVVSEVEAVIWLEAQGSSVDLALMRLERNDHGVPPIALADTTETSNYIGVIGYPAFDPRNSPADQARIFDGIYNKKRFAPGVITTPSIRNNTAFEHNCTTLGGNSGSCVIDVTNGAVVGLHYGGVEGDRNEAVRVEEIRDRAERAHVRTHRARPIAGSGGSYGGNGKATACGDGAGPPMTEHTDWYHGRNGYDPAFLGEEAKFRVPLPKLNALQQRDVARCSDGSAELKYQNFSLVMNAARRLAFFTAVNIDGTSLWHKPRETDVWRIDPRIAEDAQVDNALYTHNNFDRGHLVRRLDPVWGDKSDAERAETDTFHYTNAAPQHKDLNRKIWLSLENDILNKTDEADAKVSVLCGPIFGYADPRSKRSGLEEVGMPLGFWKVVASLARTNRRRRVLQAQAFVIWQHGMIGDHDLEIVFGRGLETYQVSVMALERLCGLDFGPLREADTLGEEPAESVGESPLSRLGDSAVLVRSAGDIVRL